MYKISKYCDELVPTLMPLKYQPRDFEFVSSTEKPIYKNCILFEKGDMDLDTFMNMFPPVNVGSTNDGETSNQIHAMRNGGISNSIINLYELYNSNGELKSENARKIIWQVSEVDSDLSVVTEVGNGSYFKIQLINDFGPRRFFEKYPEYLKSYADYVKETLQSSANKTTTGGVEVTDLDKILSAAGANTEKGAKEWILNKMVEISKDSTSDSQGALRADIKSIKEDYLNKLVFDEDLYTLDSNSKVFLNGKCVPKVKNYRDFLEPRFTANIYIDNETEILKLVNDMASIFRGLSYYKNDFITATIDVDKEVSYLFNNSNVKEGLFSYSSGSLDGNYSVAKVFYRDKYKDHKEDIVVVEDAELIDLYGIIPKEILGFGVTSRDQARRLGTWMLATNRYENETVTFTTSMQGILLKPSDIIQIEDQYKNNINLQGRVTSVDYVDGYVVVDRKLSLSLTGKIIKFLFVNNVFENNYSFVEDSEKAEEVSSRKDVFEMKIERIENNTNKVYLDQNYVDSDNVNTFSYISRIIKSCPFIIVEEVAEQRQDKYYKIISISEEDTNQYKVTAVKHDNKKYSELDKNTTYDPTSSVNNTISFSSSTVMKEINLLGDTDLGIGGLAEYYDITETKSPFSSASNIQVDFSFKEPRSILFNSDNSEYSVLDIFYEKIYNYYKSIYNGYTNPDPNNYYVKLFNVLSKRGSGFLTVLNLRNQSIKFKINSENIPLQQRKRIFLGRFDDKIADQVGKALSLKIYVYNQSNQIIQV